jgi:sialate O-acetylesterase
MKTKFLLLSVLLFSFALMQAQIKVASILGDNMVMQRNTEVKIWGKAKPGEKLMVTTGWNKVQTSLTTNSKGEWTAKVKSTDAGGPYTITISSPKEKVLLKNVLLGEVWLCSGQSNMEMPVAGFKDQPVNGSNDLLVDADNTNIRMFTVKKLAIGTPQDTCSGKWEVASAESVAQFSAVGYFFAKQLQQKLKVPVGVINSSWGGTRIEPWMNMEAMAQYPEAYARATQEKVASQQRATNLWNGMIAPLVNFAIKGAIWYQGEANIGDYKEYAALMNGMVTGWRKDFGVGEFPFYYVQIAPYFYNNSKAINSALLRDEQLKALALIPNSGMASTIAIGEEKCIHPAEKLTVGKRLAYWAFSETYGFKGINFKSPVYKSMSVKDSVAYILIDNTVNGLSSFGKEVESFEIAGADKVFYPAKMSLNRQNQVLVWASQVKVPVAVRYGFCNFSPTKGFLYNTAGLPMPSFRTDDWDQ